MTETINRLYPNQEIKIPVQTRGKQRIVCRVYNPTKPNTVYFETAPVIDGYDGFVVKIPKMPPQVTLEVYNEAHGNGKMGGDSTFRTGNITHSPIRQPFAITGILDRSLARFAEFIDDFAENAAILSTRPGIYLSDNNEFRIDYLDVIRDDNGKELATPFRVNSKSKIIQASKKYILGYTVPGRKMWLWHEGSHVYVNKNPADELEADKNAIMFYLGTGNPIIEAYNVAYKCFKNTPSDLNRQRYNELEKYISNFYKNMGNQINTSEKNFK